MTRNIYRVNPKGGTLIEGGRYPPGSEIELDEVRARSLGNSLLLGGDGKPVIVRVCKSDTAKAVESSPKDKMIRRGRTIRKGLK